MKSSKERGWLAGQTIDDVAGQLETGALMPGDVPIMVYQQNGYTYILNTRSAIALTRAGIPRSQWFIDDVTGNNKIRKTLNFNLKRDNLSEGGCSEPWSRSNPDFPFSSAADTPDLPDIAGASAEDVGADAGATSAADVVLGIIEGLTEI